MELHVQSTWITLHPEEFVLMDDENHRFQAKVALNMPKSLQLGHKTTSRISLLFELPTGYDLRRVGSLRLLWHYEIADRVYRRLTKFIKHSVEYRYQEVYPSWYIHYHWHGRFGTRFCWP
jgi:hypothetical protein